MNSKTNMEQTIQTLKGDNQELMKENASLKCQIGGYKTSNERYKHQAKNDALYVKHLQEENQKAVSDLEVQLKDARAYAKEADELNEQKATTIAELKKTAKEKDRVIQGLQDQIEQMKQKYDELHGTYMDTCAELEMAEANYDYVCELPWYKRMFFNGK